MGIAASQTQDRYAIASGTNTYTASFSPPVASYETGKAYLILFTNANTGASTLDIDGLGPISLVKDGGTALASGDINAGQVYECVYDGTNFQVNIGGGGTVSSNLKYGTATQTSPGVYDSTIAGVTSYTAGDVFVIEFDSANDGASTLNINTLGAINIFKNTIVPLSSGDIKTDQTVELVYDGTNFQAIGLVSTQLLAYVHNAEGAVISKGQVVYAYQASGNKMSVKLAKADADATSAKTIGLVYDSSIGIGADGYIIIQGVIESVNTAAFTAGDTLYLSGTTFGAVTNIKPYAPIHLVYVGIVERANAGNGQIYVRCQNGYELDEIHDVDLITVPPVNNNVLVYTTPSNLWVAKSIPTILGYTPVSGVTATAPITSSGGTAPDISTSMATNRLIGRTTAGTGVMEEIQVGTGLSFSSGVLSIDPGVISPTTTNAREDDYAPTGWPGTNDIVKVIRITPNNTNNLVSIGGLTNGSSGRIIHIVNDSTDQLLIIDHEATTSTAANRFKFKHQMSYFLLPGRDVTFIYDGSRWTELGQYNWAGLDVVDHMNAPQNTTTDTYTNTNYFAYIRSGAGAYVRSSGSNGNYDLAGVELNTGTTSTGSAYGGFSLRSAGGTNALNANGQFPFLHLTKINSLSAPTSLQDYLVQIGLESSTAAFAGNGYLWKQPTFATTYAGVWEIDVVNTAGTLAVNIVTAVSTTVDQYLGIFNHGNNGNATFFSSTDGLTYTAAYKFTRASGTFAGWPKVRIASTVGTSAKSATFFMSGINQNYKR